MDTNRAPLLANLFLNLCESDFLQSTNGKLAVWEHIELYDKVQNDKKELILGVWLELFRKWVKKNGPDTCILRTLTSVKCE